MLNKSALCDIFFDLDHTLWDFEKNSSLTFERVFEEMNIQIDIDHFLTAYEGINHYFWKLYRENKITQIELRHQRLIQTFKAIDYDFELKKISAISKMYILHLSTFTNLFEGAFNLLEDLKKKYKLHIITNGFDLVQHYKIKNSGLSPYFDKIITAERVGHKKPNPKIFKYALHETGSQSSESLMIGDSLEADILGALNSGMEAIHFNSHNEPIHDYCPIVTTLNEIQNFI